MAGPVISCVRPIVLELRIITAVVLASLLLGSLAWGIPAWWALVLGLFASIGAWEWSNLAGWREVPARSLYTALMTAALPFLYGIATTSWASGIIFLGALWWVMAAVLVFFYQAGRASVPASCVIRGVIGCGVLVPAWLALVNLFSHPRGVPLLLVLFTLIWLADSMAFFAGRRFGRHKLASRVSPGKSWEGFYAGMLASLAPPLVYGVISDLPAATIIMLMVLCLVCAVFSVIGDLLVSVFKRHAQAKDTGHILPGHGGVLDRIDSITAAAPIFSTGVWMLEGRL